MGIPPPEPGLVLNYAYLWHDEHRAGREEGRKDRPSVIVLSTTREADQAVIVTVLPITHAAQGDSKSAVEIPRAIKRHLGLDDARSWIVVTEGNRFVWPGFDLRNVPGTKSVDYGFLPPRLFRRVQEAFLTAFRAGKSRTTVRT